MNKRKIMIAYTAAAIAAGIALAVWRMVLIYRYYDPYNGEFSRDADTMLKALGYVTLGVVLLMFTSYFFIRKESFERFSASSNQVSVFSSSLCGFVFVAVGILIVVYYGGSVFGRSGGGWFFKTA